MALRNKNLYRKMETALREGYWESIEEMVEGGFDLTSTFYFEGAKLSILNFAIANNNNLHLIEFLISHGAQVDYGGPINTLAWACGKTYHFEVIYYLLSLPIKFHFTSEYLVQAVRNRHPKMLPYVLSDEFLDKLEGTNKTYDVNYHRGLPLTYAIEHHAPKENIEWLFEHGADGRGLAFSAACLNKDRGMIDRLLKDHFLPAYFSFLGILHPLVETPFLDLIRLALELCEWRKEDKYGNLFLQNMATSRPRYSYHYSRNLNYCLKYIKERTSPEEFNSILNHRNYDGQTLIHQIYDHNYDSTITLLLLDNGIDYKAIDHNRRNVWHYLLENETFSEDCLKLFAERFCRESKQVLDEYLLLPNEKGKTPWQFVEEKDQKDRQEIKKIIQYAKEGARS